MSTRQISNGLAQHATARVVHLGEPWQEWTVEVVSNPKLGQLRALQSGDLDRQLEALSGMILSWTVRGDDGEVLPSPKDGGMDELRTDLFQAVVSAVTSPIADAAQLPKG